MSKENKRFNIIIDSNIWISFLIGKSLAGLQNHFSKDSIRIITCKEQLLELSEVFKRPKFSRYISRNQVHEFFELLEDVSEIVTLTAISDLCRDKKDNYLLSLALDSQADYLITGDNDLLSIEKINSTSIISYTEFSNLF